MIDVMSNYKPVIPQHRPILQAVLGATGATIVWAVAVVALCQHWRAPQEPIPEAKRTDRLLIPASPRAAWTFPLQDEEEAKTDPTPSIPAITPREEPSVPVPQPRAPPPDTSPSERNMIANGCSPGGVRTNFLYRGVWHYRCKY